MNSKLALTAAAIAALLATAPAAIAAPTTEDRTIVGDVQAAYSELRRGDGWQRVVRQDLATASATRATGRTSLTYFGQLTDFQLSDEESPARVEFFDITGSPTTAAHRPQEALVAQMTDQAIRAVNLFDNSKITGAALEYNLITGDQADNMQRNEAEAVIKLLEGGEVITNSGVEDPCNLRPGEAAKYTGVQDHDDYYESGDHYDPENPIGRYSAWPVYQNVMDRAQLPFTAQGSEVPTYVTFGNHDNLQQGNQWSNASFEAIATGCAKVFAPTPLNQQANPINGIGTSPQNVFNVPPDPGRQMVDKAQYKALHDDAASNDHGFGYVDPAENAASDGAASYYTWEPKPGLQLISIDTVSEGGTTGDSASGNLDAAQWAWLQGVLDANESEPAATRDLVILFGHHPERSLTAQTPDEFAPPCTGVNDAHGHDANPGCDMDPRSSTPLRHGDDLVAELLEHPHVIAYVAGHTHEHKILPFERADGSGGFWEIETSAIVDWPHQARLIEVTDNGDDTLSIFGTLIDHLGPATAPAPGNASGFTEQQLASLGRTFGFNDEQAGGGTGEGTPEDRNTELLLPDPR
ncbi:MAG: metallophosphoesterase [Actinomycetota bacterium]|nr:metallophosphoesterase [Actinomycetota bacterium]